MFYYYFCYECSHFVYWLVFSVTSLSSWSRNKFNLATAFRTVRGRRCLTLSRPSYAFIFVAYKVQHSFPLSSFVLPANYHQILSTHHALEFSTRHLFVAQEMLPTGYTANRMHSVGLEFASLTLFSRDEMHLLLYRGCLMCIDWWYAWLIAFELAMLQLGFLSKHAGYTMYCSSVCFS